VIAPCVLSAVVRGFERRRFAWLFTALLLTFVAHPVLDAVAPGGSPLQIVLAATLIVAIASVAAERGARWLIWLAIALAASRRLGIALGIDPLLSFYSVPTSFFVMDERIPRVIRELITEAEGSLKMNFLTGASACTRKAIYELLVHEKAEGDDYQEKIKSLKGKHPGVDDTAYDVLAHIQDMTSDKVHEQSWPKWDSANLRLIIETLRMVLHEIYVVPAERAERAEKIRQLRGTITLEKRTPG